ncbi:MAG: peptidylprolyl isomerase [Rubricoccaceae bacterium]|nr:peptidylprolyl isomerase [Rubricoccaceae bacterium]
MHLFSLFFSQKSLSLLLFCLAIGLSPTMSRPASSQVAPGTVLDEITAIVGNEAILESEVLAVAASNFQAQPNTISDEQWSRSLDFLIDQKVLLARALRDTTIHVPEEQVNIQLEQRTQSLINQAGGEDQLQQLYGRTVDEIKASFREDVRNQMMAQQFQSRRLRNVMITPSEVRTWFETIPEEEIPDVPELVRVAHIVLQPQPDSAAVNRARSFAESLRDSILAEEATIEELARRHSQDPGSQNNGGLYNGFNVRDLVPEFGIVASTLEPGGLSQVFETQFGFHVMRLNDRQGDVISFNHILIRVEEAEIDPTDAIARLGTLRDSVLVHGVPFEVVAKNNSDDPYSAAQGGYVSDPRTGERDLRLEALGPLWTAVIDTMEVGSISEPAEVNLLDGTRAWHIVLLQKRIPAHRLSIETDYALLSQYALQDKQQRVLTEWLQDLRDTVYIEIKSDRYRPLEI